MTNARRTTGSVLLTAIATVALVTGVGARQRQAGPNIDSSGPEKNGITSRQAENMNARIAIATAIVNRLEPEAQAAGRAPGWRQASLDSLLALPLSQLRRVEQEAYGADRLMGVISEAVADPRLLGDPDEDLVYTPIPPCRFIDTRIVGGRVNGFADYDLAVSGSTYGGAPTCNPTTLFGVGDDAFGALSMNLTIIDPTIAPGFAAAKPTQSAPLSSLANWYEVGPTVQAANAGIVVTDRSAAVPEFTVQTSAPVHVIVDIFGAFLPPVATALDVVSVTVPWGPTIGVFNVVATCPAGYSVTGGGLGNSGSTITVSAQLINLQSLRDGTNQAWRCQGTNLGLLGLFESGSCQAICARVPGR